MEGIGKELEIQYQVHNMIWKGRTLKRRMKKQEILFKELKSCESSWNRTCFKKKRNSWIKYMSNVIELHGWKDSIHHFSEVKNKVQSCWISCDFSKVEQYLLVRKVAFEEEKRTNYLFELRSNCLTDLCRNVMANVILRDSSGSHVGLNGSAINVDGGMYGLLKNTEVLRMQLLDTPSINELDPLWAVIGIGLTAWTILAVLAVSAFALFQKVHKNSLITIAVLAGLLVAAVFSMTFYAISFGGAGPTGRRSLMLF